MGFRQCWGYSAGDNVAWKRITMLRKFLVKTSGIGLVLLQYGCIAHCTLEFVGDFVVCSGPSMQPTINSDDVILTEHVSVTKKKIERGDIVIARSPTCPQQHICKRVTKLEGDIIDNPSPTYSWKYIPKGHVWLEGDNAGNSTDSRIYGPVPYGLLRSRVFYKIWPVHDFGSLTSRR